MCYCAERRKARNRVARGECEARCPWIIKKIEAAPEGRQKSGPHFMFCRPFGPGSFFLCGSRGSVLRCASHSPLATLFRAFGAPRTISPAFHNLPVALFRAFGAPRTISPAFHNLPVALFRAFGAPPTHSYLLHAYTSALRVKRSEPRWGFLQFACRGFIFSREPIRIKPCH